MSDSDEYEYEYEDDEEEDQGAINIENQFYEAEKCEDPTAAIKLFQEVVDQEKDLPQKNWTFQCFYNMVQHYFKLGQMKEMKQSYSQMLDNIDSATRNDSNASIFKILNMLNAKEQIYIDMLNESIKVCESHGHDRTKVQLLLLKANKYFNDNDQKQTLETCGIISDICKSDKSLDNVLIEVYAIMMQIAYKSKNYEEISRLYNLALASSNSNNKAIATIREIGGLYHMEKQEYSVAYSDFFEALKRYQEAGLDTARKCLIYLLMANILDKNSIDPFTSREAQLYSNDKMIIPMKELRANYEANDLISFRNTLSNSELANDSFVQKYSAVLIEQMSRTWIEKSCDIFNILKIEYICGIIKKTQHDTELIIRELIVGERIDAYINQLENVLVINHNKDQQDEIRIKNKKYVEFKNFTKRYMTTIDTLSSRLSGIEKIKAHHIEIEKKSTY